MKKFNILLIVLLIYLFYSIGCSLKKNSGYKFESKQQTNFSNFLKTNSSKDLYSLNDIQKKEYLEEYEKSLSKYLDTNRLFFNWKAMISDIKMKTKNDFVQLSFDLTFTHFDNKEVTFICANIYKKNNVKNSYLYKQLKSISDYSSVYFDGFIKRDKNNYAIYNFDSDMRISNPYYMFNIVSISENKLDSLSTSLKKAINIAFEFFHLYSERINNRISQRVMDRKVKKMHLKNVEAKLTPIEQKYITRLKQHLMYDAQNY